MTRRHHAADDSVQDMLSQFGGIGPPAAVAAGPGLEAEASLSIQIGRLAGAIERQRQADGQRLIDRSHAIFPWELNPISAPGNGTIDQPSLLSPNDGYMWDLRRLTAASFTAGTVTVSRQGAGVDATILFVFTSAGSWFPGSGNVMLNGNDRLVFAAAGIVGTVTISGSVINIRQDYIGDYLL